MPLKKKYRTGSMGLFALALIFLMVPSGWSQSTWSVSPASDGLYINPVSGKVGIGTNAPSKSLDVLGTAAISSTLGVGSSLLLQGGGGAGGWGNRAEIFSNGTERLVMVGRAGTSNSWVLAKGANGNTVLQNPAGSLDVQAFGGLTTVGAIGIGTTNPASGKKLDVRGDASVSGNLSVASITTQTWMVAPDYVFEKDYKLATLDEVDSFVKKNKHLPEVPSAKDFKENGMDLAEMNFVLLKKVEELTLHAIRQEKMNRNLENEVLQLKQTVQRIAKEVN